MLILCETCIRKMENRGEKITKHYSDNGLEYFTVCDVCGSVEWLSEVTFPEDGTTNQKSL